MSIEAMKRCLTALQIAENIHLVGSAYTVKAVGQGFHKIRDAAVELDQAIKEAEQAQPVAWPCVIKDADFEKNTITLEMNCKDYKVSAGQHWLHKTQATPPKRKPLTDGEIAELYGEDDNFEMTKKHVVAFARAIEAAHNITGENT